MLVMLVSVPLIVFMVVVAPLWLILHYRSKKRSEGGLSQDDYEQLAALSAKADALKQRIHTLETILDDETPNWRSHYDGA